MARGTNTQGRLGVMGPWEGGRAKCWSHPLPDSLRQDSSLWGQEERIQRGRGGPTHSPLAERSLYVRKCFLIPLGMIPSLGLADITGLPTAHRVRTKILSSLQGPGWAAPAHLS